MPRPGTPLVSLTHTLLRVIAVFLFAYGPGRWSLDAALAPRISDTRGGG